MPESSSKKQCGLQSAHITTLDDKTNLVITLKGHEQAQADTMRNLKANLSHLYVERNANDNTITVIAPLSEDDKLNEAADRLLYLHELTGCKLSHLHIEPDFDTLGNGEKAIHTPAIIVTPTAHKKDPEDISGLLSMAVIEKTHGLQPGYHADPRNQDGRLRLFCIDKSFPTESGALISAEDTIRAIEQDFGLFKTLDTNIRLIDLRESTVSHHKGELGLATARLEGNDKALTHALHSLKHRHGNRIAELARGDNYLDIGTADRNSIDPTGLLAAIHMTTKCHLPVEVTPIVTRSKKLPHPYVAGIKTQIEGDETSLKQPMLRHATARYAGSFIADNHSVPEEMDPHQPSQVIVHTPHTQEEDAQKSAEALAQKLRSRLQGNVSKGWDYHR